MLVFKRLLINKINDNMLVSGIIPQIILADKC